MLHEEVLIIVRVAFAMLLGAIVGLERELADKPAGLRTHMLVAGAAALLVAIAATMVSIFTAGTGEGIVSADPIRLVEAIVTGISFLGAGTIIRSERDQQVEGLTTAASILLVAAIGTSVALSRFVLALGVTVLTLMTLRLVYNVEQWIATRNSKVDPTRESMRE